MALWLEESREALHRLFRLAIRPAFLVDRLELSHILPHFHSLLTTNLCPDIGKLSFDSFFGSDNLCSVVQLVHAGWFERFDLLDLDGATPFGHCEMRIVSKLTHGYK